MNKQAKRYKCQWIDKDSLEIITTQENKMPIYSYVHMFLVFLHGIELCSYN